MVAELRKELSHTAQFEDIISRSHKMRKIFDVLTMVAETSSTVLIEGETGTGKELISRAIHSLSSRKEKAFVAVNCAALPDTLLESELFGYKAGAFTDAFRDKPGRIAQAEGGTLLFDEIGEISPVLQVRLLRFLQEHTYEPLGAVGSVKADVRVIAATNRDLDELVREGRFREDLYFRVDVVRIRVPPLRERMEDIPLLVEHFIERFNRIQDKKIGGVTDDALDLLMAYHYPGNVRELENVIERAFVLCRDGKIQPKHLPENITGPSLREEPPNNYNCQETARSLGIHRTTLYRKIKRLGIALSSARNT